MSYMNSRKISNELQIKVLKHLEYIHIQEQQGNTKSDSILQSISKNLKDEIKIEFYGAVLKNNDLFNLYFSKQVLDQLALLMKEMTLSPQELLFKEGEFDDKIFFVYKGEVEFFLRKKEGREEQILGKIGSGQLFGHLSFFGQTPRGNSCRSVNISQIIYMQRDEFLETLRHHQTDYERYCMLKDKIQLYQGNLGVKCISCGKLQHGIFTCPYLHLFLYKSLTISKYNASKQDIRTKFKRADRIQLHALHDRQTIRLTLIKKRRDLVLNEFNYNPDVNIDSLKKYIESVINQNNDKDFYYNIPVIQQYQNDCFDLQSFQDESLEMENEQSVNSEESSLEYEFNQKQEINHPLQEQVSIKLPQDTELIQQDSDLLNLNSINNLEVKSNKHSNSYSSLRSKEFNSVEDIMSCGSKRKSLQSFGSQKVEEEKSPQNQIKQQQHQNQNSEDDEIVKHNHKFDQHQKELQKQISQSKFANRKQSLKKMETINEVKVNNNDQKQLFDFNFDNPYEFSYYFTKNNMSKVIKEERKLYYNIRLKRISNNIQIKN